MTKRRSQGQYPQVTFTSDFHELVAGDLVHHECVLRYDPHRIVPASEIEGLPRTGRPILVFARFSPGGEQWQGEMKFPAASTLVADLDPTGQGTMLQIKCPLPQACEEIECWFSYTDNTGNTLWDSARGTNFHLRFPAHDLDILAAQLKPNNPTSDLFVLDVESVPEVESIDVRWRYTNAINAGRHQHSLVSTAQGARKRWTLPPEAGLTAWNSPLAFDLVYHVAGHKHTDDNGGTWYIVART